MNSIINYLQKIKRGLVIITPGKLRIRLLRSIGVKIGSKCIIHTHFFSTEPYLVEIGNHCAIASGVRFLTHDGGVWIMRDEYPRMDIFGKIKVGDNTFIGVNTLILPNSEIGSNCVIGSGSVVRGKIPDNSVAFGNPAKVVFKTSILKMMMKNNPNAFMDTKGMNYFKKRDYILKKYQETEVKEPDQS